MKHGILTRLTAVVLAALMLCAMAPGAFADAADTGPVIFIPDMDEIVLYQNPDTLNERAVFDPKSDTSRKYMTEILYGLLEANSDTAKGSARITGAIDSIFSNIRYDANGNPVNTAVGPGTYKNPVSYYDEEEPINTENIRAFTEAAQGKLDTRRIYVFTYDWRADPRDNAIRLNQYITLVKATTGKKKVSLISGGYGGTVVNAYLYYFPGEAISDLKSCIFLDTYAMGNTIVGDVMSGSIVRSMTDAIGDQDDPFSLIGDMYDANTGADVGAAFARYMKNDPTGMFENALSGMVGQSEYSSLITTLIIALISGFVEDQGFLTKLGAGYKEVMKKSERYIYAQGLREYMRNMPGLWAIVPEDSYDKALSFMFPDAPSEELLAKIQRCRRMLAATKRSVQSAKNAGVNVCVAAGFDLQILPLTASIKEQSDGLQAARYAGLGATTGDLKNALKTTAQCAYGGHSHTDPGRAIDAATCVLPENTWFIRSHEHMDYSDPSAAAFLVWLLTAPSQRTVWSNENYPQFLQKASTSGTVFAYSNPADTERTDYTYGDLNVDGRVDAADARLALRYAVGLEGTLSRIINMVGDVTGNGIIDAADARLILRYAVGLDKTLKAPK